MKEYQFDGIVGPTHNYAGLSLGNIASQSHGGDESNPKEAALQGLAKMKYVRDLGVGQAVLPPHSRPSLRTLRALGFTGSDEEMISRAAREAPFILRQVSSASSMWAANAATTSPSADAQDAKVHFVPANLLQNLHRSIETPTTTKILQNIFEYPKYFKIHGALPSHMMFGDEGAANHTRLVASKGAFHIFAWGRSHSTNVAPKKFPARQTLEASRALARHLKVKDEHSFFPQQNPDGIDAGAFHTDVVAVGNRNFLMAHELAFVDQQKFFSELKARCGDDLVIIEASNKELPIADAVKAYPFNSQVLTVADGSMHIIAPKDSEENVAAKGFLDRVVASNNPVKKVHYLDVRQSMRNGGGPACLRLRVVLLPEEEKALAARVVLTDELHRELFAWVGRHYRDRLTGRDLEDPKLARESMVALDELTEILELGPIYDFQQS